MRGSLARKYEFVSFRIFEGGHGSPTLFLGLGSQDNTVCLELDRSREDIIAPECHRLKAADTIFMASRRKQRESRFGPGNEQFDPTLRAIAEELVGS